jgi:hypothetical protein
MKISSFCGGGHLKNETAAFPRPGYCVELTSEQLRQPP